MTAGRPPAARAWSFDTHAPGGRMRSLVDRVTQVDRVAPISDHVLDAARAGEAAVLQADAGEPAFAGTGPVIAGIAVALAGDPAEVTVDPEFRGRGLGTELVEAGLERQGAVWAYGDLPAARAVAERLRLRRTRVLLQMRRSLPVDGATAHRPSSKVRLRTFEPGRDEPAFLAVNARAFATHPEQGRLDLAGLRDEMAQDWFDPAGFFLAVTDPGDELLGFHWTKVHRWDRSSGAVGGASSGPIGEIYVLGVDPDAGVPGLGRVLAQAGLRYLGARNLGTVMLYVEADNDRAVRLYERLGFTVHLRNVVYRPPG